MENKCIISVAGKGTIEIDADALNIDLKITRTGEITSEVMKEVNITVNKILSGLNNIGINKENISISSMDINEYNKYDKNNNECPYQQIEQSVKCIIYDLKLNKNKVIDIIDFIGSLDEKVRYRDSFFIKENKMILKQCKDLAFKDAFESAEQYAKLANITIKKIIKISEFEPAERNIDYIDFICAGDSRSDESIKTNFNIKKIKTSIMLYIDFIAE